MRTGTLLRVSNLSLPSGSFIYSVLPIGDSLAAISSDDSLRIFDRPSLDLVQAVEKTHEGVTCLEPFSATDDALLTAGRDGTVRCWDTRLGKETLQVRPDVSAALLSLATAGNLIAVGTELSQSQASVIVWDYRSPHLPLLQYLESHNDDVTELRFHPQGPSRLLSGSTDGLVNIYDISITDEDDALIKVFNHGSSISHAGFLSGTSIYALSHDESFSIYPFNGPEDECDGGPRIAYGDLRPVLNCEYIVDVIPLNDNQAIIGAGSHGQCQLDLVPLVFSTNWNLDQQNTVRLAEAHGQDIIRSLSFNAQEGIMYTAGEDSLVKMWQTNVLTEIKTQGHQNLQIETPTRKRKKSLESQKARFKPY